jgi:aspartate beta-hydroxylase
MNSIRPPKLDNAARLRQQAHALLAKGDWLEAKSLFCQAVLEAAEAPILRLELGQVLERLGDVEGATRSYFLAVMKARARGLWLDDDTVPPAIFSQVYHAMKFVEQHRDEIMHRMLEPCYDKHGRAELTRVTRALDIYLQRDLTKPAHHLQKPLFLYVPGLREQPYYDPSEFEFTEVALAAQSMIAQEASVAITGNTEPFLNGDPGQVAQMLAGERTEASWEAYFFYRHGQAYQRNLARCPITSNFLKNFPRVDIPGHAPEICFSVLSPGSHILPHTGVTNSRLVVHLPLKLPSNCALRVAGQTREWKTNELLIFDDTFEHEAWNRSDQPRTILLMDTWHPDLQIAERDAITALVAGIGVFNRG